MKISPILSLGALLLLSFSLPSCDLLKKTPSSSRGATGLDPVVGSTSNTNTTVTQPSTVTTTKPSTTTTTKPSTTVKADTVRRIDTLPEQNRRRLILQQTLVNNQVWRTDTLGFVNVALQRRPVKMKDSYNVAVLMPFHANEQGSGEIIPKALRALEFYEGVKLALDDLGREGVKLNVSVFDTQRDEERVEELLQKRELQEADLIIGPISSSSLRRVADFALEKQIPLVSPFNPLEVLETDNPFYIQVNPSYEVHGQHIIRYAQEKTPGYNKRFLILAMESDSPRVAQIQEAYRVYKKDENARLPVVLMPEERYIVKNEEVMPFLSKDATNVVIMPSFEKEHFIQSALQQLGTALGEKPEFDANGAPKPQKQRGSTRLIVVGMPQWRYYEKINFDYYEYCNLHLSSEAYINNDLPEIKRFRERYFKTYGMVPREFGYVGYDLTLYFGRLLKKHSTGLVDHLDKESKDMLHTRFEFKPVFNTEELGAAPAGQELPKAKIRRYENHYINLMEFDAYQFRKLN